MSLSFPETVLVLMVRSNVPVSGNVPAVSIMTEWDAVPSPAGSSTIDANEVNPTVPPTDVLGSAMVRAWVSPEGTLPHALGKDDAAVSSKVT